MGGLLLGALALAALPASAQMSAQSVAVTDLTGLSRPTFSTNEMIAFSQSVFSVDASTDRVAFTFEVYGPAGQLVFTHGGNSSPGSAGTAASRVAGVPVTQLDKGSGAYRLVARAQRGAELVTQEAVFQIFNPNLTLTFPSNGTVGLAPPVVMRWVSSGASKYRISVGENPSFFNSVFSEEVPGTESQLTYPENPPDTRQRLTAGTVYYWTVEGLDANGNAVSKANTPFSFSIKDSAATVTRDIALARLDLLEPPSGPLAELPFVVELKNQGGTTESNLSVKLEVGGNQAFGSPATVASLGAGQAQELRFTASMPPDQVNAVAVACHTLFDDAPLNNCMTLRIAVVEKPLLTDTTGFLQTEGRRHTPAEAWDMLKGMLKDRDLLEQLKGYHVVEVTGEGMTRNEVDAVLRDLREGEAKITGAELE